MTLNASGPISIGGPTTGQSIELELSMSGTAQASLNDSNFRTLAAVPSGQISMSDFYGKSAAVTINLTISSNTANYNIRTAAGSPSSPANVTVTINGGVTVYSNSVLFSAIDTGTGWTSGSTITIVNSGLIVGKSGDNGQIDNSGVPASGNGINGEAGGTAFRAQYATTFTNSGTVAGGGGQGGFGGNGSTVSFGNYGGGGGHGQGGSAVTGGDRTSQGGGAGNSAAGGAGGTSTSVATGGFDAGVNNGNGAGGGGGYWGAAGAAGGRGKNGASLFSLGGSGGAAGLCVSGVSFVNGGAGITTGSRYGNQV